MSNDLLKDRPTLTITDVCEKCDLTQETVITYVQEGLIKTIGDRSENMLFSEFHIVLIQKALRLERDLRLNPAGSVLALELMAQIDALKNQLKYFERKNKEYS